MSDIYNDLNNIPNLTTYLEAKKSNSNDDTQKQVIPLTGKRCPPGYIINKKTGMCELFNPSTLKKTKAKTKKKVPPIEFKKSSSHSSKSGLKLEMPNDLVRKIFTKKIKLEELDRYIPIIEKGLEIHQYLETDPTAIYGIKQEVYLLEGNNFFSKNINYKKIIKEFKISYNDSTDKIIKKVNKLTLIIIEVLKTYIHLLDNINDLYNLYYENGYDENADEETINESKQYFDKIKNEEMEWYNGKYQEPIYEKINLFNENHKYLKKFGLIVNEKYIKKINYLIDTINKDPNLITKLDVSLKTYKLSKSNSRTNSNSRSNSSTRKTKKIK